MKKAFTLMEILVVIILLIFVMTMIAPKGYKMLESFQKKTKSIEDRQKLSLSISKSFLQAREIEFNTSKKVYYINAKGIIIDEKKSDDNH